MYHRYYIDVYLYIHTLWDVIHEALFLYAFPFLFTKIHLQTLHKHYKKTWKRDHNTIPLPWFSYVTTTVVRCPYDDTTYYALYYNSRVRFVLQAAVLYGRTCTIV